MPQTINRESILKEVRCLVLTSLQGLDVSVYLFGSWARNEESRSSDIDLGVMYDDPLPSGILANLRLTLEESTIPYRVEVVDLTKTDHDFRKNIMKEAILWNACNNV